MARGGLPARIGAYLAVAVALAVLGYVGSHSLAKAGLVGLIGIVVGVIVEVSKALENKGVLPQLRHDGYGVQTPSWYESEQEQEQDDEEGPEDSSPAS